LKWHLKSIFTIGMLLMISIQYFQLKKWSNSERQEWLKENTAPYTA